MRHIRLWTAVLAFVVSSAMAAYGQTSGQEAAAQAKAAEAPAAGQEGHEHPAFKEKRFVATVGSDGIQHVETTGGEYYFDPNYIVVKVNVPVELIVKKAKGYVPHDLDVNAPEAGIVFKVDLKDKPQVVRFTPTKVGTYEMFCTKKLLFFKSHKDKGMDGYIEVVP